MSQDKKDNNEKKEQAKDDLDIDNLLNQFGEGQLNLTNQQKKQGEEQQDAETMKRIKEQYEKFMKQMQGGQEGEGVGGIGKAFEELLTGFGDEDNGGQKIGEKFESMFKNLQSPQNFEKAASELLNEFMDKSLLEQPLKETKKNYEEYLNKLQANKQSVPKEYNQYKQQYKIVCQLVETLEKEPGNKSKMIELFSKLQEKGTPPEGIAPSFGFF